MMAESMVVVGFGCVWSFYC